MDVEYQASHPDGCLAPLPATFFGRNHNYPINDEPAALDVLRRLTQRLDQWIIQHGQ